MKDNYDEEKRRKERKIKKKATEIILQMKIMNKVEKNLNKYLHVLLFKSTLKYFTVSFGSLCVYPVFFPSYMYEFLMLTTMF